MERIKITNAGPLILAPPINLLAIVASSARSKCILKYLFPFFLLIISSNLQRSLRLQTYAVSFSTFEPLR